MPEFRDVAVAVDERCRQTVTDRAALPFRVNGETSSQIFDLGSAPSCSP
jgi:hypothetical protein